MLIASCRFLNKIGDKVKKAGERIDDEMDRIQAGVARLPTAIRYTYNPKSVYWCCIGCIRLTQRTFVSAIATMTSTRRLKTEQDKRSVSFPFHPLHLPSILLTYSRLYTS